MWSLVSREEMVLLTPPGNSMPRPAASKHGATVSCGLQPRRLHGRALSEGQQQLRSRASFPHAGHERATPSAASICHAAWPSSSTSEPPPPTIAPRPRRRWPTPNTKPYQTDPPKQLRFELFLRAEQAGRAASSAAFSNSQREVDAEIAEFAAGRELLQPEDPFGHLGSIHVG